MGHLEDHKREMKRAWDRNNIWLEIAFALSLIGLFALFLWAFTDGGKP